MSVGVVMVGNLGSREGIMGKLEVFVGLVYIVVFFVFFCY